MIDIKLIRENPELFKEAAKNKNIYVNIDRLMDLDRQLGQTRKILQDIATQKNQISKNIPRLSGIARDAEISFLSQLKKQEKTSEEWIKARQPEFDSLMLLVAQPADKEVPLGKDDTENVEIRREGQVRQFDFKFKDHMQLGVDLGIIDVERGVKLAGTRSYFLKGDGARLHWAVLQFAMDVMIAKGYTPMSVPLLMQDEAMRGTGYYPGSEEQTYRTEEDREEGFVMLGTQSTSVAEVQTYHMEGDQEIPGNGVRAVSSPRFENQDEIMTRPIFEQRPPTEKGQLNLAGTAEVPLTAYRMGEILDEKELPIKFAGMSTCFRREAGAAGKDTYGLYRIHQFDKVEQVVICKNSVEESSKYHEEILNNSEVVMKALEVPYRIVAVCTGDLGRGQAKKYDIEAWMPSRNNYCETHSASKFYEFQARRMNLRYKDSATKKNLFCHTLNNTVIASPRVLIPIMELYQNADGSITVPKVLQPYMGGKEKIVKHNQ
jgi:seryl-tRNA synthetase